ncbi:hypothetical protein BC826DRAFT_285370 [Russula brevipes]|nr:hypothetical protein BC826DRAFT_285370 [Russula brevipes]
MPWRPLSASRAAVRRHVTSEYVRTSSRHERRFHAGAMPPLERGLIPYPNLSRNRAVTILGTACQSTDLARSQLVRRTVCASPQAHVRCWLVPRHKGNAASPRPQRTDRQRCCDLMKPSRKRKSFVPSSVPPSGGGGKATDRELLASRPRCGQTRWPCLSMAVCGASPACSAFPPPTR